MKVAARSLPLDASSYELLEPVGVNYFEPVSLNQSEIAGISLDQSEVTTILATAGLTKLGNDQGQNYTIPNRGGIDSAVPLTSY